MTVERVDFCITTIKRPEAVERLVLSIGPRYPNAAIHIGDQNETLDRDFYEDIAARSGLVRPLRLHTLPYDCGVSAARNRLVASTSREYKLILDDDLVFTEETDLGKMVALLDENPRVGVVGGSLVDGTRRRDTRAYLEIDGDTLLSTTCPGPWLYSGGVCYMEVDFVANCSLMRSCLFAHIRWDPRLSLFEHHDFFVRLLDAPYSVLFTPDVAFGHRASGDPAYRRLRRRVGYMRLMMRKHGLSRMVFGGDLVTELLSDGSIVRFRAPTEGYERGCPPPGAKVLLPPEAPPEQ